MTLGYPGTTVRTSTPSDFKAIGRAPVTSASSPILIKGNISEATESTRRDFIIQPVDHRLRDHADSLLRGRFIVPDDVDIESSGAVGLADELASSKGGLMARG